MMNDNNHPASAEPVRPSHTAVAGVLLVLTACFAGLFALGWAPHAQRAQAADEDSRQAGTRELHVSVVHPRPAPASRDIVLPGDVRPMRETAIIPRAAGYLERFLVDIGDRVTAGQLLAEIATPEVDADLAQAKASLEQSRATCTKAQDDVALARRTWERVDRLEKMHAGNVTQQDLDDKRSAVQTAIDAQRAAQASVGVAESNVQHLLALQGFERVVAPFSGIITARNYDRGALFTGTASTTAKELFRIVQTDPMRVFVNVPQEYATSIRLGDPAWLSVRNFPGRELTGSVARNAGALDQSSRTLLFELHFANSAFELLAGMYGEVRLSVTAARPLLSIPTSALLYDASGMRVALVQGGKIHFRRVSVGRDLGVEMEIVDGLARGDAVVSNPGENLAEGIEVVAHEAQPISAIATAAAPVPSAASAPDHGKR